MSDKSNFTVEIDGNGSTLTMHLPNLVLHVQSLPPVEPLASFHTNFFHSLVPTLIATSSSHLPRILQIRFVAHPPNPVPLQTSPQQSSRRWLRGSVGQKCGDANMDFGIECTRELRGCVTMVKDQDHAHCPYVKTRLSPAPCFAPSCPSIGLVSHARTFLFHSTNCFQYLCTNTDQCRLWSRKGLACETTGHCMGLGDLHSVEDATNSSS